MGGFVFLSYLKHFRPARLHSHFHAPLCTHFWAHFQARFSVHLHRWQMHHCQYHQTHCCPEILDDFLLEPVTCVNSVDSSGKNHLAQICASLFHSVIDPVCWIWIPRFIRLLGNFIGDSRAIMLKSHRNLPVSATMAVVMDIVEVFLFGQWMNLVHRLLFHNTAPIYLCRRTNFFNDFQTICTNIKFWYE